MMLVFNSKKNNLTEENINNKFETLN